MPTRRALLGSVAITALLFGCKSQSGTGTASSGTGTPANILAFASGLITTLGGNTGTAGLLQDISTADPKLLPASQLPGLKTDLTTASGLLSGLSTTTAALTSASTLQTAEGYFNDVVMAFSNISPDIPQLAPFVPLIDAVTVGVSLLEQYVNVTLAGTSAATQAAAAAAVPTVVPAPTAPGTPVGTAPTAALATLPIQRARILAMRANAERRGMTTARAGELLGVKTP